MWGLQEGTDGNGNIGSFDSNGFTVGGRLTIYKGMMAQHR